MGRDAKRGPGERAAVACQHARHGDREGRYQQQYQQPDRHDTAFTPAGGQDRDQVLLDAEEALIAAGAVVPGDLIVLTIGEPIGKPGGTNTMKIVRVGERKKA